MYGGRDIYCVRHCEREDNENPYWFYNSRLTKDNPPLSERGTDQAKEIARGLASVQIDYAFSSPCRRTVETASYILAGRSTKLCLEPGLLESESIILGNGVGSCSFESDFEIEPLFPGLVNDSYPRLYANVIPGEVGLYGCRARVQKSIANILRCSPRPCSILIVGHQSSLAAIHEAFCPGEHIMPGQATVTKYTERYPYEGVFDCEYDCDASHLSSFRKYKFSDYTLHTE
ncbi:histidine phosphatase superfamily (branch 1) domain-containing protein [Ditylenchus destructor]|nr:histidine phosphatase superfamily (branch 1) domain-containing protein [Ditylenchus destructor]